MGKTTGAIIKNLLEKKKMSQKELCERTGISEPSMSKYLSSGKTPRTEVLIKISDALGVDVYYLLGKKEGTDTYQTCKTALLARSGKRLTDEEKKELINLILSK